MDLLCASPVERIGIEVFDRVARQVQCLRHSHILEGVRVDVRDLIIAKVPVAIQRK